MELLQQVVKVLRKTMRDANRQACTLRRARTLPTTNRLCVSTFMCLRFVRFSVYVFL